jgi:hypothetical protein
MHKKHAKDGLAVISVSIDDLSTDGAATKAKILKFLKEQKATELNLILDEPQEVRADKLHFELIPSVFVFNREGKWTQFKTGEKDFTFEDIEKLVLELLKKK